MNQPTLFGQPIRTYEETTRGKAFKPCPTLKQLYGKYAHLGRRCQWPLTSMGFVCRQGPYAALARLRQWAAKCNKQLLAMSSDDFPYLYLINPGDIGYSKAARIEDTAGCLALVRESQRWGCQY